MKKVISVRFKENGKSYYFDPAGADIKTGDYVIVETARGIECGEVVQGVKEVTDAADTIMYYIYYTAFKLYRYGYGNAMGVVLAIIIAILSAVQFKLGNQDN